MVIEELLIVKDNENNKISVDLAPRKSQIWNRAIALNKRVERITTVRKLSNFLLFYLGELIIYRISRLAEFTYLTQRYAALCGQAFLFL